jgi:predicted Zn-dependent protease
MLFPCNLGINLFLNSSETLIENLIENINLVFDSFFYNIFLNNWSMESEDLETSGREECKENNIQLNKTVLVYPTNLFYKSLNKIQNNCYLVPLKLGITDLPLYSSTNSNLIFLYGEANVSQRLALVSTYNLQDFQTILHNKRDILEMRIIKESIHEIGHIILGVDHCIDTSCVMNYSKNLEKVDDKSIFLCNSCLEKIEEIRENYNF